MDIRTGENYRESWWVTNNTDNEIITIGDLLLAPVIKPNTRVDLLRYYSREKISQSAVLTSLVNAGLVSLNKKKIYADDDNVSIGEIEEAITPAQKDDISSFSGILSITNGGTGADNAVDAADNLNLGALDTALFAGILIGDEYLINIQDRDLYIENTSPSVNEDIYINNFDNITLNAMSKVSIRIGGKLVAEFTG